jgi:hypothetical protein
MPAAPQRDCAQQRNLVGNPPAISGSPMTPIAGYPAKGPGPSTGLTLLIESARPILGR